MFISNNSGAKKILFFFLSLEAPSPNRSKKTSCQNDHLPGPNLLPDLAPYSRLLPALGSSEGRGSADVAATARLSMPRSATLCVAVHLLCVLRRYT